jgi:uncharacterized protein (DUF433 family)
VKKSSVSELKHSCISVDPLISGGSPVVSGTRVRVIDIVIEYDRLGLTPDQIIDAHPQLSLEEIHYVLSYYYENRDSFDDEISKRKETIKRIAKKTSSILKDIID